MKRTARTVGMSELIATQIPKPHDEQAFERCNVILWRCILKDETAHLYARRGQPQYGVDILGCRDAKLDHLVGIQCKLKSEGKELGEEEVRQEVDKALTCPLPLSEYIIVTTAPDDVKLHNLVKELSLAESKRIGRSFRIAVFGWDNLQCEIRRYPDALKAFDPSHTPQGDKIERQVEDIPAAVAAKLVPEFAEIRDDIAGFAASQVTIGESTVRSQQEGLIDDYVTLMKTDPRTALDLLAKLQTRLRANTTTHIRFRIASNIAACELALGNDETAAKGLIAAYDFTPNDPKAIANKAFGFLLLGDSPTAKIIAEEGLQQQPDNAALAASLIRSVVRDERIDDPLSLIPESTRHTSQVTEAYVTWLKERGVPNTWWDAAIASHTRYPDSRELEELCACALLSRAIGGERFVYGQQVDTSGRADARSAINIYESQWPEVRDNTLQQRPDSSSTALNLMLAYRLMGDFTKATAIGWEALKRFPTDDTVTEYLAISLLESGDIENASDLISGVETNPHVNTIRYNIAVAKKDWSTVVDIVDTQINCFPESEHSLLQAMGVVAGAELASQDKRRSILETGLDQFRGDTRALIALSQCARGHGLEDLSHTLFNTAKAAFRAGDNRYICRVSIAEESMLRGDVDLVVDALSGHVFVDRDSAELRLLAEALVHNVPIREGTITFFEELPPETRNIPFFQRLEGILHFNRGAPHDAIKPLTAALEREPHLNTLLCLIRAYFHVDDRNAIAALVRTDVVDESEGSSLDRVNFSHVLLDFNEPVRALDNAYRALTTGVRNPEVVMRFLGLVLRSPSAGFQKGFDDTVSPGVWVRLTQDNGQTYEALIGEPQDRPWGQTADPGNAFIRRSLGLRSGETFEHVHSMGKTETWTVTEIKPRWLQAFHHLTSSFGQRFPGTQGFESIAIENGDIEPVLEQVRRQSAIARERADLYLDKGIPLVSAAGERTGGALGFAEYLVSIGKQIRVCTGRPDERTESLTLIHEHDRSGAVLDAFTAWHAAAMGVLPVLAERLGPLAIPAYEVTRLKEITQEHVGETSEETMSLDYRAGQYIRRVESAEERAERLMSARSLISAVEMACEVEPVQIPNDLSELGEKLVRLPPIGGFSSAIIAGQTRLLLCEDMMMRQFAHEAFGVKGVWLQSVLFSAEQAGTMSINSYADAVVYLAAHQHGYIWVSTPVLLSAFNRSDSRDLVELRALCAYVGDENAEIESNTKISAEFINAICTNAHPIVWVNDFPVDSKTRKATTLVFHALLGDRRDSDWARWGAALYRRLDTIPRRYLLRWCEDNFLSVSQLLRALGRDVDVP